MAFYIIAFFIVVPAILVIVSRNPVISAIWLVVTLFAQAALFVLLNAELVAVLQVLLYAGAIMVLILFVIMMLNLNKTSLKWRAVTGERLILGLGAFYLLAVLSFVLWMISTGPAANAPAKEIAGTIEATGKLLLTKYVVPFELLSVLLLAAIVGSVVLSKKQKVKET